MPGVLAAPFGAAESADAERVRWRPAPDVTWCTPHGTTVLLSLDHGRYHTLNEVGSRIWQHLCAERPVDEIARLIAREWEVGDALDEVAADVRSVVEDLARRRLIVRASAPARVPASRRAAFSARPRIGEPPPVPSALRCFVLLATVHVLLKVTSLRRVLTRVYRQAGVHNVTPEWIQAVNARIATAGLWYPFAADCLERSLLLVWFLRRAGLDATLRIGVVPYPFEAHAWAEYRDWPLNETAEPLQRYCPFPVIEP